MRFLGRLNERLGAGRFQFREFSKRSQSNENLIVTWTNTWNTFVMVKIRRKFFSLCFAATLRYFVETEKINAVKMLEMM